jgi:hypothetical protein
MRLQRERHFEQGDAPIFAGLKHKKTAVNFSPGGSLRTRQILFEAINTGQREQVVLRAGAAAYSDGTDDLTTDD